MTVSEFPLKFPLGHRGEKSQLITLKDRIHNQSIARIWGQFVITGKVKK